MQAKTPLRRPDLPGSCPDGRWGPGDGMLFGSHQRCQGIWDTSWFSLKQLAFLMKHRKYPTLIPLCFRSLSASLSLSNKSSNYNIPLMQKSILLWNCSTYPSHVSDQHHHTVGFCSCLCRAYWFRWWKFIGFDAMKSSPLQHGCIKVIVGLQCGPPPEKQETTTWKATLWTFHSILVLQKRTHHIKYPSFPTIIFFRFLPPLLLYNLPPPPKKKEPPQKNTFFGPPFCSWNLEGG